MAENEANVVESNDDSNVNEVEEVESAVESDDHEVNDSSDKKEQKLYTPEEVSKIVSQRVSRMKSEAIKSKVEEAKVEIGAENEKLLEELRAYKEEFENVKREKNILEISSKTGISGSVLSKTGLSGKALEEFANDLVEEKKNWSMSSDAVLNSNVLNGGKKEEDWREVLENMIKGDK